MTKKSNEGKVRQMKKTANKTKTTPRKPSISAQLKEAKATIEKYQKDLELFLKERQGIEMYLSSVVDCLDDNGYPINRKYKFTEALPYSWHWLPKNWEPLREKLLPLVQLRKQQQAMKAQAEAQTNESK